MERELTMTGIGGQGVQLAAQVLARAAVAEGREVLLFGSYGGMMRGGNTDATLIVADAPIESPPTIARTWSAIAMHHEHWPAVAAKLVDGSLVLVNTTVFDLDVDWSSRRVVEIPATRLAAESTGVQTASMVMLGAYIATTDVVELASAQDALADALPPYRSQHVARNRDALALGFGLVERATVLAWAPARAAR